MVFRVEGPSFWEKKLRDEDWKYEGAVSDKDLKERIVELGKQCCPVVVLEVRGKPYETVYQLYRKVP